MEAARAAWRAARVPYSQTEALRFGNWFIDEWEVQVNAWPVDEGFLDYVAEPYLASPTNPQARANLIAAETLETGGSTLRLHPLNRSTLISAQNRSDVETNVATGYHAIEFLLWGQDLDRHGVTAGQRPWTDYSLESGRCTDGVRAAPVRHCRRRGEALRELATLLVFDLAQMAPVWGPQDGSYGDRLARGDPADGLRRALYGLATFGNAELAGERQRVALLTRAPEEEQDCFSDDTHNSLYFNALGIENFYFGRYGSLKTSVSLADLARATDAPLAANLERAFAETRAALKAIRDAGASGRPFDQLIGPDSAEGEKLLTASIAALERQSALIEALGVALGLGTLNPQAPRNGAAP
jgi:putative iron-regulated protein